MKKVTYEQYEKEMSKLLKSKRFDKLDFGDKFNTMLELASKYKVDN